MIPVDLTKQSTANLEYMIEGIKSKLKMATAAAMQASHYDERHYEDIYDIYEIVMSKDKFSISEIEALVAELGKLRKE